VENFVLIGVFLLFGMMFRRLRTIPSDFAQALNTFALYIPLPAVILLKVPQLTFSREALVAALTPWGMLLFSAAAILAAARFFTWPRSITGVLLLVVPLGNTSFMGVPMVQAFFGEAGFKYLIIYDQIGTMLIFATYGSLILALYGRDGSLNLPAVARRVLLFPPTVALVLGLLLRSWPYPEKVVTALQNIAACLTPLVMTAVGFQMRLRLAPTALAPLGFGLGVKLVAAPLLALGACRLLGLDGLAADISVLEAAMPPMVTAGALAVMAGMDAELSAALVGLGIVLAFGTLPLIFLLL
jgi:predicted permease